MNLYMQWWCISGVKSHNKSLNKSLNKWHLWPFIKEKHLTFSVRHPRRAIFAPKFSLFRKATDVNHLCLHPHHSWEHIDANDDDADVDTNADASAEADADAEWCESPVPELSSLLHRGPVWEHIDAHDDDADVDANADASADASADADYHGVNHLCLNSFHFCIMVHPTVWQPIADPDPPYSIFDSNQITKSLGFFSCIFFAFFVTFLFSTFIQFSHQKETTSQTNETGRRREGRMAIATSIKAILWRTFFADFCQLEGNVASVTAKISIFLWLP